MRAWDDVSSKTLYATSTSQYYINNGVKIERFDKDGRFEIKNILNPSDQYEDVTSDEFRVFLFNGWQAGVLTVGMNTYYRKAVRQSIKSDKYREGSEDYCRLIVAKEKSLEKMREYRSKLEKLNDICSPRINNQI
jgi:hypothetical protein